jgi:hypothetical protein
MSPKARTRSLQDHKTEEKLGLSRHYREIGIKAVAAAAPKENTASRRSRDSMATSRKRDNPGEESK